MNDNVISLVPGGEGPKERHWPFSDAVQESQSQRIIDMFCTHCNAKPGQQCRTAEGNEARMGHELRFERWTGYGQGWEAGYAAAMEEIATLATSLVDAMQNRHSP